MKQRHPSRHWVARIFTSTLPAIVLVVIQTLVIVPVAFGTDPPGATFQAGTFSPPAGWDFSLQRIAFHEKSGDAFNLDRSLEVANPLGTRKMQFVCMLGLSPYELTMGMVVAVSWDPSQVIAGRTFPLKIAMTPIDLDTPEVQSNYGFEMWAKEFSRPNPFVDYEEENTYTVPYVPDLGLRIRANGVTPLNGQHLSGDDSLDFLNLAELVPKGDEGSQSQGGGDVDFPIDIPLTLTGGLRITGDEVKTDLTITGMYNSDGTISNPTTVRYIENLRWLQEGTWTIDVDVPATAQVGQCLKVSLDNLLYLIRMEKRMGMELEIYGLTVSTNSLDIWEYVGQWYISTDLASNRLQVPIPVTQSAADLTLSPQDVSFTFENVPGISGAPHIGDPAVLDRVTAHIQVTNQSKTPLLPDPMKKLLTVFVDELPVASEYLTSGFAAMETKTFSISFWVMSPGMKTIRVQLNPGGDLGEVFDENNTAEKQLNVTAKWGTIEILLKDSQGTVLSPGNVLDLDSGGKPRIFAAEKYSHGAALYQGSIQPDGKVKFDVPAGLYTVFVRTKPSVNYLDANAEINLHEATGVVPYVLADIVLPVMATVTGTVLDYRGHEPIPPAPPLPGYANDRPVVVSLGVYSTECDHAGSFIFARIVPGTYKLRIEHPFFYKREITVTAQPGQNLDLGDILMIRDAAFDTTGYLTLEANTGGGGSIYTQSRSVKISAWAEDVHGIAGMRFRNDGEDWQPEVSSCPSTWTLRDEDGERTVNVQFKDSAGNWSGVVSASIRLDRQGPIGSVTINNGEESTDRRGVILTFGATDPANGTVAAVSLSNDGIDWSPPLPYVEPMVWTLSGSYGIKTVYAKFLDACGNWSSVVSDSIQMTPAPSITLVNTDGLPITDFTKESQVYAKVCTGIFADSPTQTQAFSGESTASENTAAAQSFVPPAGLTICGAELVATRNTWIDNGRLRIELRIAPPGATNDSSPENSVLVTSGTIDAKAIGPVPPGFVDVSFNSSVTLEAGRIYFLVAKAETYSAEDPFPEFMLWGAWLWPDGNGNPQDAYPDGKLWTASTDGSGTCTWSSLDTETGFPERHDLAFRLMLPANEMRYTVSDSIPNSIEAPWLPFATYVPIGVPGADGHKTIAFQLKHPSYIPTGESQILLARTIKDTTTPEIGWQIPGQNRIIDGRRLIESGQLQLVANARDATSGVKEIRIGLNGNMDDVPWLNYATYASSSMIYPGSAKLTYTLPYPDGQYDLCLQVRDTAGNISSTSIPILKDQFGPSIEQFKIQYKSTTPDGTPCVSRRDIKARIIASDLGSKIVAYRLGAAQNMSTNWINVNSAMHIDLWSLYNLLPGDGLKSVFVQVKDRIGRISWASQPVYLRTSGPARPVLASWADHPDPSDRNLTATWSACTDPTGVTRYQIQIASDSGFASVLATQTFEGLATSYSWTAPPGSSTYYFRVRAQNTVGFWSEWTSSDALQVVADTIEDAKLTRDGQSVVLRGIVTASFSDCFYIENENRTIGIRVQPGATVAVNTAVTVEGVMGTTPDLERVVLGQVTSFNGASTVTPLGITNKALGGADWRYEPTTQTGQRGVYGGTGQNNIGLLVRIWGKFTPINKYSFLVNDGSGPVLCQVPDNVDLDPDWQFVRVTGISSCYYDGTHVHKLLRVREVEPM